MTDILQGLNTEQRQAVTHVDGPLLIFAGAGSGKTRVIVHRVAHLIKMGIPPAHILCLTFTNKAAGEMKERLERMLGHGYPGMWAGTFHAFGAWFLRHEAHRIGYPRSFIIYDSDDQRSLVGKCIRDLKLKTSKGTDSTVAWLIAMAKDTLQDYNRISFKLDFDPGPVIKLYEERKQAYGAFDFGDLLKVPGEMLRDMPEVRSRYQSLFRYILVDEYQDTNMAQYVMLMGLVNPEKNLCVVGDDDQSIYGWRGADVGNILRFKDDFPQASVVTLEQNYRSTEGILNAAATLIANNRYRAPKKLKAMKSGGEDVAIKEFPDDEREATWVAHTVLRLMGEGVSPAEIGVFYRVNALSRVIEENFVRLGIPYAVFGGMRFYERREIKDVLAYLRIMANPRDEEALARIINTPTRGIGPKTVAQLQTYARGKGLPTLEAMEAALAEGVLKNPGAKGAQEFLRQLHAIKARGGEHISDLMQAVMDITGLESEIKSEIDGEDRLTNIRELIASAEGQTDLVRYLEEKALINNTDLIPGDKVSVMTLHISKGLEFDYVFILGLEEGLLPHSRSMENTEDIEEERRLLYVGITRARHQAYLSWSRVRALYGRESYQYPSGFLWEIQESRY
jgi:DNA helicase II / ATP-dependent DNA helicase PcrA